MLRDPRDVDNSLASLKARHYSMPGKLYEVVEVDTRGYGYGPEATKDKFISDVELSKARATSISTSTSISTIAKVEPTSLRQNTSSVVNQSPPINSPSPSLMRINSSLSISASDSGGPGSGFIPTNAMLCSIPSGDCEEKLEPSTSLADNSGIAGEGLAVNSSKNSSNNSLTRSVIEGMDIKNNNSIRSESVHNASEKESGSGSIHSIPRNESDILNNGVSHLCERIKQQSIILANKQSFTFNIITSSIEQATTAINYNNTYIEEILMELKVYTDKVFSLETQLKESNDKALSLETQLKASNDKNINLINELVEKDIDAKDYKIEDLTIELENYKLKEIMLNDDINKANSIITEMKSMVEEYKNSSDLYKNQVTSIKHLLSEEQDSLAQELIKVSELNQLLDSQSDKVEKAKSIFIENKRHIKTIAYLENKNVELEIEIQKQNSNLTNMKLANTKLFKDLELLVNESAGLNEDIKTLGKRWDLLANESAELNEVIKEFGKN